MTKSLISSPAQNLGTRLDLQSFCIHRCLIYFEWVGQWYWCRLIILAHLYVTCWSVCDQDQDFDWWNLLSIACRSSFSEALDHLTYSGSKKRKGRCTSLVSLDPCSCYSRLPWSFMSWFRLSQESESWDYWSLDWFLKGDWLLDSILILQSQWVDLTPLHPIVNTIMGYMLICASVHGYRIGLEEVVHSKPWLASFQDTQWL